MPQIGYKTRCHLCGQRFTTVDDYGDYNVFVKRDGNLVRKTEDRWFDPDWVLQRHIRLTHMG